MRLMVRHCMALFFAVVAISSSAQERQPIQFEHIFDGTFSPKGISQVRWMNNGRYYSASDGQKITRYDITNGEEMVLFDGTEHDNFNIQGYEFSANEELILLKTDVEPLWRRSTKENYWVYNRNDNTLRKLISGDEKQQYAELSPDGTKAAYVQNNNLFWVDLASGEITQITNDGAHNSIINGAADWVYEEEIWLCQSLVLVSQGKPYCLLPF